MARLLRIGFTLFFIALFVVFAYRFLAPGPPQARQEFRTLAPAMDFLAGTLEGPLWPVSRGAEALSSLMPSEWQGNFPVMPSATLVKGAVTPLLALPGVPGSPAGRWLASQHYDVLFPGETDWRYPLALVLGVAVENLLFWLLVLAPARVARNRRA